IRIVDGTGLRIIRGAGRRFIMADGFIMHTLAGAGLPATFGGLRGYPGAITIIIAAGHHCLQGRILLPESASRSVDTASATETILACDPTTITSSIGATFMIVSFGRTG